jgi:hypothetical protein
MFRRVTSIILLSATASVSLLPAQVRTESAPVDDYVLRITQMWGRESALGDARALTLAPDDVELRVWGGYGLTGAPAVS